MCNFIPFETDRYNAILAAQNSDDIAKERKQLLGYLKMWRDYHTREGIEVTPMPDYAAEIDKIALKRQSELEQAERIYKGKLRRMNKSQLRGLLKLWKRSSRDFSSFLAMRRKAFYCYGDYYGINWCGMFIGIERDGYTHS